MLFGTHFPRLNLAWINKMRGQFHTGRCPVLLPGLSWADLFVVVVHVVVEEANDGGLSCGGEDDTQELNVNDMGSGLRM